jgi:putative transposase
LQAKLPEGVSVSRQLDILTDILPDNRARQIAEYRPVARRRLVDWLVAPRIGTLAIGKHDGWKQQMGLRRRTNQNVVFIPHARFSEMLRYQADLAGIQVIVTEERDTSTCSVLALEPVGKHDAYAGKRVKRGLLRASGGRCLNADSNGAYNIRRKVVPKAFGNGRGGVVVHPVRITLMNGPHGRAVHVA